MCSQADLQARLFGSPNHTITPYEAAVSATHLALVSILAIPTSLLAFAHVRSTSEPPPSLWDDSLPTMRMYDTGMQSARAARKAEEGGRYVPLKFSSVTDWRRREHVSPMPVLEWDTHEKEGAFLVDKCEALYQSFLKLEMQEKERTSRGIPN